MKKLNIILSGIIFSLVMLFVATSCEKAPDGHIDYEANPTTEVGKALVENTSLVATFTSEENYSLSNGVDVTEIRYLSYSGYSTKIFVIRIDLNDPKITLRVTTPNNKTTYGFQKMTEQATFVNTASNMVLAGVNGDFFNTSTGMPNGVLYKQGKKIKEPNNENLYCFAMLKNKRCLIGDKKEFDAVAGSVQEALGGGVLLVEDGMSVNQTDETANPRTCIGIDETSRIVTIMVVDGRNYHYSNGMTYDELAQCMLAFGCETALNLDGGGSSTFFTWDRETSGSFILRNLPSDNGGEERAVANGLVITYKK